MTLPPGVTFFCAGSTLAAMSLESDLQYVISLAVDAGRVAGQFFGQVERQTKTHVAASSEAVTEADRATQRFIVSGLRRRFPDDGIIGEENDTGSDITMECPNPMGRVWVIDPIDGTNNFIAGFPAFAVCIGLLDQGNPVLGVVYDVSREIIYSSAKGHGASLNGKRIRCPLTPMGDSSVLMLTSNLIDTASRLPAWAVRMLGQTNWKVRVIGSAALEACTVASGVAHGAITVNGKLWDVAAPAAIVLEAGGVVTDLSGKPIFPYPLENYRGAKVPFIAAGKAAHRGVLDEIVRHP